MEYALVTENLTKRFGPVLAVDHVTFRVRKGEICSLLGPNGAGKTTLIEMLIGALTPTSGTAMIFGRDIRKDALNVQKKIGYLPENCGFYKNMSGFRFLRYMAELGGMTRHQASKKAHELLGKMELLDYEDSKIATYSGGMKQRLGIAQTFITNPELVILDEPTSDLDPLIRVDILDMIDAYAKKGKTVLIASHILSEIKKVSDVVAVMDNGRIKEKARLMDISGDLETFYKKALQKEGN
ncbi:MAG: ABC transporter ATP-binding protein [Candidatus Korarchaeota archaeon]|nr:ABC transporter ATP-binding protein [Candidatus Korarchaeota archaeon]NIU85365.1 ATP-binding cassette domain-containing protein [Candidatus Thorarchaeota archaeon]NIW15463.1 ATP-binding cassette domain-containing protein [Candidatus Thorarchaeota archaeon]NIW53407.1 ATP-binding cassette domain-containing protein [Candidatus Korarchaeota archaeon]